MDFTVAERIKGKLTMDSRFRDGLRVKIDLRTQLTYINKLEHLLALQQCKSEFNLTVENCHIGKLPQEVLEIIYFLAFPYSYSKWRNIPAKLAEIKSPGHTQTADNSPCSTANNSSGFFHLGKHGQGAQEEKGSPQKKPRLLSQKKSNRG